MKERHVKTIVEKYGERSVREECLKVLIDADWRDEAVFNSMPHLGIGYVSFNDTVARQCLIHYVEKYSIANDKLVKVKIIQVGNDKFSIAHYDGHHGDVAIRTADTNKFKVVGNIIKSIQHIENGEEN